MNISKMSVKRPVTTLMLMFIAILLGVVSLSMLPIDLYPEMEVPVAIVSVNYSGVGPEEIETLITKPIEQSDATVSKLKDLTSYSMQGSSIVVAEFDYGVDMDFAALEMREKVADFPNFPKTFTASSPASFSPKRVIRGSTESLPIWERERPANCRIKG